MINQLILSVKAYNRDPAIPACISCIKTCDPSTLFTGPTCV